MLKNGVIYEVFRLMKHIFQIIKASTNMYDNLKKKNVTSQLLFGESFTIVKECDEFAYGLHLTDNYKGWILKSDLGELTDFNYYVSEIRTNVLTKPNIKSQYISYLPMRAKIKVIKNKNGWAEVDIGHYSENKIGFVIFNHLINKDIINKDWVLFAQKFYNSPYRWGGRDSLGIDCSALLQLSLSFAGISIPRDTSDQIKYFIESDYFKVEDYKKNKIKRSSIIFWEGHVGVAVNENKIIHASGHHHKVVHEELHVVIKRINKKVLVVNQINE